MQTVKTAISIQKPLFDEADHLAQEMSVSRSRLFVIAITDYIERKKNRDMLLQINEAWSDEPDPAEQLLKTKSRRQHKRIVTGTW